MKSLAVLSLLVTLALAQSPSNTPTNPLIPSNISTGCGDFLNQLDADPTFPQCLEPLISATAPLTTASTSNTTSTALTSALTTICTSTTCDPNAIAKQLGLFYGACQAELINSQIPGVKLAYDALYLLAPLQKALCATDTSGQYCAVIIASSSTAKRASLDRRSNPQEAFVPNITTYGQNNIAFLGLQPNLAADKLCVPCTRNIMNAYTSQLSNVPYGPGVPNSVLFPGQQALYDAINATCGSAFLGGESQAVAGALATGAAPRSVDGASALIGSAIVAAAAGVIALL
ncbi:hypothetical protein F5148DRAFT_1210606 [Russula earlei]|uniref:Uncharacterized protein n=1 Tax=Russula earlei TaxID=71964 RepID=A0ACC0U6V8_9AGAM|nr:hypothetical protein F5148DRAFT_1210606 [Russula earlei]